MTHTRIRPPAHLAGATGLTALFLLGSAGVADASCVAPPTTSASSFTGTVLATQDKDRIAQVRTDAGAEVTVVGTESPDADSASSVDRTFVTGARYEFHPLNEASPFRDNACTATRQLKAAANPTAAAPELPRTGVPGYLPVTGLLLIPIGAALTYRFRPARRATS
ncbi:MAG: hypothetical protein M3486_07570 [Actinomycetota bacterium]|nr:hypothetical protein [Actinomycetota bacterium]